MRGAEYQFPRTLLVGNSVNKPLCGNSVHSRRAGATRPQPSMRLWLAASRLLQEVNVVVRWSGGTDLLADTRFELGFESGKLAEVLTPCRGRSRAWAYEHRHHE